MAGSVRAALRRAIVTGFGDYLANLADFNGNTRPEWKPLVSYGYDFGLDNAERVYPTRVRADTPPAAMRSGRNFRKESGVLDVVILVKAVGGNYEDADDRAEAIGQQLEEWIADRKQGEGLAISGLIAMVADGWEQVFAGNTQGAMSEVTYKVRWTARLT